MWRLMDGNGQISPSSVSHVLATTLRQKRVSIRSSRSVLTVFRWRPGRDSRYKKTEVCQTCCKLKNVCQVCLLDLEYGLPVQVRDTALSISSHDAIPKSDVNREYFAEEHDRRARAGLDYESSYGKVQANDTIMKLQRTTPYYKRNRAHVCSFYIRGECTRGAECPYRHEMPVEGELSQQNIKHRYYGSTAPGNLPANHGFLYNEMNPYRRKAAHHKKLTDHGCFGQYEETYGGCVLGIQGWSRSRHGGVLT